MTGFVTGTVTGAAVGLTGALSSEQATRVRARLAQVRRAHDVPAELQRHIAQRAQRHWPLGADASGLEVMVELQDLQLSSTRDEQLSLVLQVSVSVRLRGVPQAAAPEKICLCRPV